MSQKHCTNPNLAAEISALADLGLDALRAEWCQRWGSPPLYHSRECLTRAFAHKLQVEAFGDLSTILQRRASELAERFMADRHFIPPAATALLPGSSLIREWQSKRHEVAVADDGFVYQGVKFRSLSKVAHHITGTKWNGPAFFGLKRKGAAA